MTRSCGPCTACCPGDAGLSPSIQRRLLERLSEPEPVPAAPSEPPDGLTARETEVLVLIAEGLSNQEIARRLHVSTATVKTHINNLFAKTGLKDRAQAVRYAYAEGACAATDAGESPDGVKSEGKKSRGSSRSVHPWACSQATVVRAEARVVPRVRSSNHDGHGPVPGQGAEQVRYDDPWYDALASGWGESGGTGASVPVVPAPARSARPGLSPRPTCTWKCSAARPSRRCAAGIGRFVVPAVVGSSSGTSPTS